MADGPTRGAREPTTTWRASPVLACSVRVVAYAVPVLTAYVVIRVASPVLYRPGGFVGVLVWIVQAAAIGAAVSHAVGRLTRHLLPLATLLRLTLVFPDRAPSRFGVALRSGTVRQMRLRARELERDGLGSTAAEAAENAVVLVNGLGRHDRLTRGHTERVRAYADLIAEEMGLSDIDRSWLAWGVLLHDVGKMTVPAAILNKSERLTAEEWGVLKGHPAAGAAMLEPLAPWLGDWILAAAEHHERWDGQGYPSGLQAQEISLAGRITAVADAYDVITSKRSYKDPMSAEAARRELVDCSGTQFDPAVVRAMLAVSIGHPPAVGSLAWLTEIPVVRAAVAVGTSPAAAVIGTAAIATSALLGLGDDTAARRAAFASELGPRSSVGIEHVAPAAEADDPAVPRPSGSVATDTPVVSETTAPTTLRDASTVPPTTVGPLPAPPTTVPSTTAPSTTAPSTTVPPTTVPPTTVPPTTVPPTTVPPTTVGPLTVPEVTVPPVTVPPVTVPPVIGPTTTIPSLATELTAPELEPTLESLNL